MPDWLYAVFAIVIAALTVVAAYYLWRVRELSTKQKKQHEDYLAALNKQRQLANESLQLLAKAYLAEQVELPEAALRISRLLDQIDLDPKRRETFRVFDEVTQRIAHIPILQEWRKLSKESREQHRKTLARMEGEYRDFAKDAAQKLLEETPY